MSSGSIIAEETTEADWVGTLRNPLKLTGPIPEEYPSEFKERPYIYVQETDGQIRKVYRSYADYCD